MADFTPVDPLPTYPPKGFRLFGLSEPMSMNACLHFASDMGPAYIKGYQCAAESLIKELTATGSSPDNLVYPILFLYRQHLELVIKAILHYLGRLGKRPTNVPKNHKLMNLWKECQIHLKAFMKTERDWLSATTECIRQICEVDPTADAFRYPLRTDGRRSAEGLKHINLVQLHRNITPICCWLEDIYWYLVEIEAQEKEMHREGER